VELTRNADRCEVAIVPPRGMQIEFDDDKGVTHPPEAKLKEKKESTVNSRKQLICVFEDATPGHYCIPIKKVENA